MAMPILAMRPMPASHGAFGSIEAHESVRGTASRLSEKLRLRRLDHLEIPLEGHPPATSATPPNRAWHPAAPLIHHISIDVHVSVANIGHPCARTSAPPFP